MSFMIFTTIEISFRSGQKNRNIQIGKSLKKILFSTVSFGTLASLFLGCSLISVAEIIYFSLRSVTFFIHSKVTDDSEDEEDDLEMDAVTREAHARLAEMLKAKEDAPRFPYRMYYRMHYPMLKRLELIQRQNY